MALQFKNYPYGSVIGSGSYVFRHFGEELIKLDTPTNLSVSDTVITFDEVENATSYKIYVDGTYFDTYTPT